MNETTRDYYLDLLGIDQWIPRSSICDSAITPSIQNDQTFENTWEKLRCAVAQCTACELHKSRTQTVFGKGNPHASLMFIGEAPGATEDAKGEPFVGRAGQLLTSMMKSIGFEREEVFIANILKCRPPNNRDPLPSEVATCTPFLQKQIDMVQPKLVVALGRIAAHYLLNITGGPLGVLRNTIHSYGTSNTPLLVTYHPAYLLRSPREKAKAYEDMLRIKRYLG